MEITLDRNPFPPQVSELLKELCRIGFFPHGLLIGSWPMLIYTLHFTLQYGFATNDVDFAVHGAPCSLMSLGILFPAFVHERR